jgi:uncharacterized membrane protein
MSTDSAESESALRRVLFLLDLFVVVVVTLLVVGPQYGPELSGTLLQVGLGVSFVLFVPGYALVSALFPSREPRDGRQLPGLGERAEARLRDVSGTERIVLSVGLSLGIVPLVGLSLNFVVASITSGTMLRALGSLTMFLIAVTVYRRLRLPAEERYAVDPTVLFSLGEGWVSDAEDPTERVLNVFLAVGLVLAMSGIVYAVAAPMQGETYTEFYILSENPETNNLTADNYPTEFAPGAGNAIHVGIENAEQRTVTYTVVVELQRFQDRDEQSVLVQETELDRFQTTLAHNETYLQEHDVQPTIQGESLRLTFMLYQDTPPGDPNIENAYRHLHIWIDSGA